MLAFIYFTDNNIVKKKTVRQTSLILLQGVPKSVPLDAVSDTLLKVRDFSVPATTMISNVE